MKIGILTFHCVINYGAVLQAYALKEFLKKMGHDVYVIDYKPYYLIKPYRIFLFSYNCNLSIKQLIKNWFYACLVVPIRWKRYRAFNSFVKKRLNLYDLNLSDNRNDFDTFVFGSDQIWNTRLTNGVDKVFWGDCVAVKGKKLIAYAASAGYEQNLKTENILSFKSVLDSFSAVSVRESFLQTFFKKQFYTDVPVVLDPVLLIGKSIFEQLAATVDCRYPYLLLFQFENDKSVSEYATQLAEKMNLKLVEITSSTNAVKNKKLKQTLSPEKFLGYIKNATYIVTTSFHGTALSILFEKNFNTISCGKHMNERALSLLTFLGIRERLCSIDSDEILNVTIDYTLVNDRLQKIRNESESFLRMALDKD